MFFLRVVYTYAFLQSSQRRLSWSVSASHMLDREPLVNRDVSCVLCAGHTGGGERSAGPKREVEVVFDVSDFYHPLPTIIARYVYDKTPVPLSSARAAAISAFDSASDLYDRP